jgi:1-Cys peroxiredoxin 6
VFVSDLKWICSFFQAGGECMVLPTLKDEEATDLFPKGFFVINLPSGKPYLRITPQP